MAGQGKSTAYLEGKEKTLNYFEQSMGKSKSCTGKLIQRIKNMYQARNELKMKRPNSRLKVQSSEI